MKLNTVAFRMFIEELEKEIYSEDFGSTKETWKLKKHDNIIFIGNVKTNIIDSDLALSRIGKYNIVAVQNKLTIVFDVPETKAKENLDIILRHMDVYKMVLVLDEGEVFVLG